MPESWTLPVVATQAHLKEDINNLEKSKAIQSFPAILEIIFCGVKLSWKRYTIK